MTDTFEIDTYERPLRPNYARQLSWKTPFKWLKLGLRDTLSTPLSSLFYGFVIFLLSVIIIGGQIYMKLDYILLPVLAGFMVMGPAIAVGLYEKSRRLALKEKSKLTDMLFAHAKSRGQILFVGVILMLLMLLWLRAAFLLYALFFGMAQFQGFDNILGTIFTTPLGWGLLGVGSAVGGLFAAFSFAISAFSIPMLLNEKKDAFTAMGISMAMAWSNKGIAIVWGAIVILMFALCLITGLLGLIFVFPILGHATWHAYVDMRGDAAQSELTAKAK